MKQINITKYITLSLVLAIGAFALWYFAGAEAGVKYLYNLRGTGNDGLVGYWPLDGNANDESGRDNNGTLTGTTVTTGKVNTALYFNGSNDKVVTSNNVYANSVFANGLTLTAWTNMQADGVSDDQIVSIEGYYWLGIDSSAGSKFAFEIDGNGDPQAVATSAADGNWHFVAGVADSSGNLQIFVDGILQGTGSETRFNIDGVNRGTSMGAHPTGSPFLTGSIDDVRIYNRALSAGEIKTYYDTTLSGRGFLPADTATGGGGVNSGSVSNNVLTGGLVGHWTFDGKDVNWATGKINDISGNSNTGKQIKMSTTTSPTPGVIGQGLRFDGVDDYVDAGSGSSIDNTFDNGGAISIWIKPKSAGEGGNGYPIGKDNRSNLGWGSYLAGTSPSLSFSFVHRFSGTSGTWHANSTFSADVWTHVVVTYYNGSTANDPTIYINSASAGTIEDVAPVGTRSTDAAQNLLIGGDINGALNFDGSIDDVRIYNRALTPSEVEGLYNLGAAGKRNLVNSGSATNNVLTSGLVGHWTFDGPDVNWSTGKINDISGNNNTGKQIKMSTTTSPTPGVIGQGLRFDGTDDVVDFTRNTIHEPATFTISAWIKPRTLGVTQRLIGNGCGVSTNSGYSLLFNSTNVARLLTFVTGAGSTDVSGVTTLVQNQWYHVVGTYNTVDYRVYLDGKLDSTPATGNAPEYGGNYNLTIGASPTISACVALYFDGSIDDVRIYNRALSASEIQQLYRAGAR